MKLENNNAPTPNGMAQYLRFLADRIEAEESEDAAHVMNFNVCIEIINTSYAHDISLSVCFLSPDSRRAATDALNSLYSAR